MIRNYNRLKIEELAKYSGLLRYARKDDLSSRHCEAPKEPKQSSILTILGFSYE